MAERRASYFVMGFAAVLVAGLFLCRFEPAGPAAQEEQPPRTAAPELAPGDLRTHGFWLEPTQRGLPRGGQWRGFPAVADFNRDGHLDLATSNRKGDGLHVYLGDGRGGFRDHSQGFGPHLGYGGAAAGDVNEDGYPDVIFSTHRVPMTVYLYRPDGPWVESRQGLRHEEILHDVAAADFDGDGHLDIVGLGLFGGGLVLFRGDGRGHWERVATTLISPPRFGRHVLAADVNGDGRPDIVATHGGVKVLLNQGDWHFRNTSRGLPVPRTLGTFCSLAVADVDGRPGLEVAAASLAVEGNRGLGVYALAGNQWVERSQGLPVGISFSAVAFADLNGDKHVDLVAGSEEVGIHVFLGDGRGRWRHAGAVPESRYHKMTFATGDFDEDGRVDLVVVHPDRPGGVVLYLNRAVRP